MQNNRYTRMEIKRPLFWVFCLFLLVRFLWPAGENGSFDKLQEGNGEKKIGASGDADASGAVHNIRNWQQIEISGRVCQKEYRMQKETEICVIVLDQLEESMNQPEESLEESINQLEESTNDVGEQQIPSEREQRKAEKIICYLDPAEREPYMGQRVTIRGKRLEFSQATNPGEFDQKKYYQSLNISYKIQSAKILAVSKQYSNICENLYQFKVILGQVIDYLFEEQEAGILKAMLLGEKTTLDADTKQLYQLGGIIHVLAISGLHISMIGMGLFHLTRRCRIPTWLGVSVCILVMVGYGWMTGMGISCVRAIFMFGMHISDRLWGRTYDMLTALSVIGIWILCEQPYAIYHSGFLLSFGAVVAIGMGVPWFQSLWQGKEGKEGKKEKEEKACFTIQLCAKASGKLQKIKSSLLFSLGIMIFTLPILMNFYYTIPLYSFLLNLVVLPLMSVLMVNGLCTIFLVVILLIIGKLGVISSLTWVVIPGKTILKLFEWLCNTSIRFPYGILNLGKPEGWQIFLYYLGLCILLAFHNGKSSIKIPPVFQKLLLLFALIILCHRNVTGLSVTFLDVGQGDGIVITNENGNCYMVDGGSTSKKEVGKYQMLPFLKSSGICRIEAVFLSHPDEDHMSGIMEIIEQTGKTGVEIGCLVLPDVSQERKDSLFSEIRELAKEHGIPIRYMGRGDEILDNHLRIQCLSPAHGSKETRSKETRSKETRSEETRSKERGSKETNDINEISEVLYLQYGDFSMLLTGDVTGEPEESVSRQLAEMGENNLSVLKVAHHGSKNSTPEKLLQITSPQYAVISVGENNSYGHPHKETLNRLEVTGSKLLRTDELGAIILTISPSGEVEWKAYRCFVGLGRK